jgi:hypothetical protein
MSLFLNGLEKRKKTLNPHQKIEIGPVSKGAKGAIIVPEGGL